MGISDFDGKQKLVLLQKIRKLSTAKKVLLLFVVLLIFMGGFIGVSEQPFFCNSCHIMNPYYASWQKSPHNEVACLECHVKPGFIGHVKGKINGMAQAIDCLVGRTGTKPNANVADDSCLREGCHSVEKLDDKKIEDEKYKFTHKGHIDAVVDGNKIACGTCHSHFEGTDHFKVNVDVCFTCHFLKNEKSDRRIVETTCNNCHDIPTKVVSIGEFKINHIDFETYKASCEESCHKRQIEQNSNVNESSCLTCHSFKKPDRLNSVLLHQQHSEAREKVECFACHGEIIHGPRMGANITNMLDCRACHSDTHNVQQTIYKGKPHPPGIAVGKVLGPMFMTHVECNGCHTDRSQIKSGSLNSLGTVALAGPKTCDRCHEKGTGKRYISYWQATTKKLYNEIKLQISIFHSQADRTQDKQRQQQAGERIKKAEQILQAIAADGSWGVHNFKYTESMLLQARQLVENEQ